MRVLVVGAGMIGAATARHLAPRAEVVLVAAPSARMGGGVAYGAHHDEGRIVRELSRDPVWAQLVRLAQPGLADLAPDLVVPCGAISATSTGGPDYLALARHIPAPHTPEVHRLTAAEARRQFPTHRFRPDETVAYEPGAGRLNPRRYVQLAIGRARQHGVEVVAGPAQALHVDAVGVEAELIDGTRVWADVAVIATGAFAAGSPLLPKPRLALRAKSEIYALAELSAGQAAQLAALPCVVRTLDHPALADLYVLPPIRYPDGKTYIKFGANTLDDRWLADPAAVRAWYRDGESDGPLAALRAVAADLLPDVEFRSWHTRRCADAYTAHGRPYLDVLEPGRLVVALGGNGHAAQCADALGALTAELALTGEWTAPLARDDFRPVAAGGPWRGLGLLRDQPGR